MQHFTFFHTTQEAILSLSHSISGMPFPSMGFAPVQPSYDRSYDYGSLSGPVESDSFHEEGSSMYHVPKEYPTHYRMLKLLD